MIENSEFRCPYRTKTEIGKAAADFRNMYWKEKSYPIDMEMLITKGLGLDIIPETHIDELTKTDAYLQSDCTAIVIDMQQYMDEQDRYASRLRFAMAHEVGHYILHRQIYKSLVIESIEHYVQFIKNTPEQEYKAFEWQANEFAGSLLVPRSMLRIEIQKVVEKIITEGIAHLLPKYANDILARNLESLARPFGVSSKAIEIRIQVEKLWPPTEDTFE
jgi:Zn-dependent peptidase ImmA (M78 family)